MAASVWMTSPYVRVPKLGSFTGSDRCRAETMPLVTVGPPFRANAYPMATTCSPSSSWLESPSESVGMSCAPIFNTARSEFGSPPMTRAVNRCTSGGGVITVMCWAHSTTCQFVTMIPSERMTNPVPTPRPCCVPKNPCCSRLVVTFTTDGRTRWTTATTGSSLGLVVGSGALDGSGTGEVVPCSEIGNGALDPLTWPAGTAHAVSSPPSARRVRIARFIRELFVMGRRVVLPVYGPGWRRQHPDRRQVGDVHGLVGGEIAPAAPQVRRHQRRLVGHPEDHALGVGRLSLVRPLGDPLPHPVQRVARGVADGVAGHPPVFL